MAHDLQREQDVKRIGLDPVTLTNSTPKPALEEPLIAEAEALALGLALGAREIPGWSTLEESLTIGVPRATAADVADVRRLILEGEDPLGMRFTLARTPKERRGLGATYTPAKIVHAMVDWAEKQGEPMRVVDPGVGSGRFLIEAGRRFPRAILIGSEIDPVASILARANLAVHGLASRAMVVLGDYRSLTLEPIAGRTLFLGNPPYVRHHQIESEWKAWLSDQAHRYDLPVSQLSGLYVHFYLATFLKANPGDYGTFITAAEWLDVNYGQLVRTLFLERLGGRSIVVIEPTALPFADAATTAAITTFEVGTRPATIAFQRSNLESEPKIYEVARERLKHEPRWSRLSRPVRACSVDHVELGELCRVHRGQVTGANAIWIASGITEDLPASVLFPSITKARELFQAGRVLEDANRLKKVIDLPIDLDGFDCVERLAIERFLDRSRSLGADLGYIARTRRAWWSVQLREPAPILATYMARRPPAFVRNLAIARHINIAHGLYPRQPLSDRVLTRLVDHLATHSSLEDGRIYAGGLTKFEPREMERLLVPRLEILDWPGD